MQLSEKEIQRYQKHLVLHEIGREGQSKLKRARVLIVGVGGLGCAAGMYLCAAGVGTIGLVDGDRIELSNLQRQVLYEEKQVGELKVEAARRKLLEINPEIRIVAHPTRLDASNAADLARSYDVIVGALDNYASRYVLNDACVRLGKVYVEAGVQGFCGNLLTIVPGKGPCYRCVFPDVQAEEDRAPRAEGVASPVPGILGTLQANETIKAILGLGELLVGRLLTFDGIDCRFFEVNCGRDPSCPTCSRIGISAS